VGRPVDIRLCRLCAPRLVRDRIVCVPAAGAGATFFRSWHKRLPPWTEVWVAELPGHGSRLLEPPCGDGGLLVDSLVRALRPLNGSPFHLFGHSFGGTLAGQALRVHPGLAGVRSLIVSASLPPQWLSEHLPRIDQARLLRSVQARGFANVPLIRSLAPFVQRALRADLAALSSLGDAAGARLQLPVAVFAGISDRLAPLQALRGWSALAAGQVSLFAVPAGHFFFHRRHTVDFFKALARWLGQFDPIGPERQASPAGASSPAPLV
jgi:medium-chain acyl-[acyl-carrier-protein] hydrolase